MPSLVAYCTDAAALDPLLRTTLTVTLPALCAAEYVDADSCKVSGSFVVGGAGDEGGGVVDEVPEPPPPQPASAQAPKATQLIQGLVKRMAVVL